MYHRISNILKSNSFFLFGPRGTGKSSLLKAIFTKKRVYWINLLNEETYRKYLLEPTQLEQLDIESFEWIVIDEVQRVPALLNCVHHLIENKKIKFALTGSSSRKLKREGANLLAGRAFENHLHPLCVSELRNDFDLHQVLEFGSLPKLYSLNEKIERQQYLRTYVNTYIKNEIKEEQLVRKIEPFIRFLEVAAQMNGKILNFSKIERDCGVGSKAVERYYEVLIDTLLGFYIEPFHESVRKRQSQKAKFYFFDLGVKRALDRTLTVPLMASTPAYGLAFEHFFILECIRLNDYYAKDFRFSYLKTKDDLEIDLIVDRPGAERVYIEIKSSKNLNSHEVSKYRALRSDLGAKEFWFVSQDLTPRMVDGFRFLGWTQALEILFGSI